jgi:tetraacyldisaccharide 4'-kinase
MRAALYRRGILSSVEPPIPTICVGNLSVGGTGKTPITLFLTQKLSAMGRRPLIVSRGYRGRLEGRTAMVSDGCGVLLSPEDAGDEPVMMARRLPRVPVVIGSRRPEAVAFGTKNTSADVAVCDDAFQHLRLRRKLNVLCVDGAAGFGNHQTLPLGPLREPISASRRADVVLCNNGAGVREDIEGILRKGGFSGPIINWHYVPVRFRSLDGKTEIAINELVGKSVHALAATARPDGFFQLLEKTGVRIAQKTARPDHHYWSIGDFPRASGIAAQQPFMYHVATEKDSVKLNGIEAPDGLPILILIVEPVPENRDANLLDRILAEAI